MDRLIISVIIAMLSGILYAASPAAGSQGFFPTESKQVNWVFSGVVTNENGENYNYLFQLERNDHAFHVTVALFDAETKALMFQENSFETIEETNLNNWVIGQAFLRFNPINNSWIFGLKDKHHGGFNFKVDLLNQPEQARVTRYFRHGVSFVVIQTGRLDGHIQFSDHKEQFVTAKNTWFRQIWVSGKPSLHEHSQANPTPVLQRDASTLTPSDSNQPPHDMDKLARLDGLLCRFNDGSGLYSMKVLDSNAVRGAVAGLYDHTGVPSAISQFIHLEQKEPSAWLIRITAPKMQIRLSDTTQQNAIVVGFVSEKNKQGFCMISQDEMG